MIRAILGLIGGIIILLIIARVTKGRDYVAKTVKDPTTLLVALLICIAVLVTAFVVRPR